MNKFQVILNLHNLYIISIYIEILFKNMENTEGSEEDKNNEAAQTQVLLMRHAESIANNIKYIEEKYALSKWF